MSRGRRSGYSLAELVIALMILQVGLLAVVGMAMMAQRRMADASLLVRAVGSVEAVTDSLLLLDPSAMSPAGSREVPPFLVRWSFGSDGLGIEARHVERLASEPVFVIGDPLDPPAPGGGP